MSIRSKKKRLVYRPTVSPLADEVRSNSAEVMYEVSDRYFEMDEGYGILEVSAVGEKVTMVRVTEIMYGYEDQPLISSVFLDNVALESLLDVLVERAAKIGVV